MPNKRWLCLIFAVVLGCLAPTTQAQDWIYTVRPGDTLWDLADKYLTRGVAYTPRLQELNAVADPKRLQPGSRLRFPVRWLKQQPVPVKVISVQGEVTRVRAEDGSHTALANDALLHAGDSVITGAEANAVLEFADGSRLTLRGGSHLVLDALSAYGDTGMVDTRTRLQRGRIDNRVAPARGPGSRYEIHTPAAVSAVRGTDFRVSAEIQQPVSRTEVLTGGVAVTGEGRTRRVPASFGVVARAGKPPPPPRRLLERPDVSQLPDKLERVPVNLRWPALPGAVAYRVQVGKQEDFGQLFLDRTVTEPATGGFDLSEDGDYILRLRGVDDVALEGIDAVHRFTLDARPEPPVSVQPNDQVVLRDAQPQFKWSIPENARSYRFQLATTQDFAARVLDLDIEREGNFTPETPLVPGTYYWRLATRDQTGEVGPFGDSRTFTYTPPPPTPTPEPPNLDQSGLTFRWQAGMPGQRYHFQLARDPAFAEMIADEQLQENQFRVVEPTAGRYYMRVATIDTDGFEGEFGTPQHFDVPYSRWWALVPLGWLALILLVM